MLSCGLSSYNFAFFHLFTHASFKALLSLSAGTFIHLMGNEQDLRKMGGAFTLSVLNSFYIVIGSITLMGLPFLSGFFSKEPIIQLAFLFTSNPIIFIFAELGAMLTVLYSLKIFYYLFFKKNFNIRKSIILVETNYFNVLPLALLAVSSVLSGYLFKVLLIGIGNNIFFGSIFTLGTNMLDVEFISFLIKIIPLLILMVSSCMFIILYAHNYPSYFYSHTVFLFFNKKMFIDNLINLYIGFFFYRMSYKIFFLFDKGLIEVFGPFKIIDILLSLNQNICRLFCNNFKNSVHHSYLIFLLIFIFYLVFVFILAVL
jgi:NADH-ubiquinone oxidoreductase chain 5